MRIVIRGDSSFEMGTGHLMRCLTLAGKLRSKKAEVYFVCRELPGHLCDVIEKDGFFVFRLPYNQECAENNSTLAHAHWLGDDWRNDAEQTKNALLTINNVDWLIIDHYALDHNWETKLRPFVKNIMVIDDLADRVHDCDVLLDQNLHEDMESRYHGLLPVSCKTFLGPTHAILRNEFIEARKHFRPRDGYMKRMLLFFGGSDVGNMTMKALEALIPLVEKGMNLDVVVGSSNPNREQVREFTAKYPAISYHCQINYMAFLMLQADIAIGAGGIATWERCYVGLPSLTVITAENQVESTVALAKTGAIYLLGTSDVVTSTQICAAVEWAMNNRNKVKEMTDISLTIMGTTDSHRNKLLRMIIEGEDHAT